MKSQRCWFSFPKAQFLVFTAESCSDWLLIVDPSHRSAPALPLPGSGSLAALHPVSMNIVTIVKYAI